MMPHENDTKKPEEKLPLLRRAGVQRKLIFARYLLPLFSALLLPILGVFYNVSSLQLGRRVQVSVLQLWFNTVKATRAYLLGGDVVASTRNFYVFLSVGAVLVAVLFLVSLLFAAFALFVLYRTVRAAARGDKTAQREAKILLKAFLPNRVWMAITNVLVLPLALFPELFSFICGRFLTISGSNAIYIRCNVTAIVIAVLCLISLVLAVINRKWERAQGLDLFFVEEEDEEQAEEAAEEEASQA